MRIPSWLARGAGRRSPLRGARPPLIVNLEPDLRYDAVVIAADPSASLAPE